MYYGPKMRPVRAAAGYKILLNSKSIGGERQKSTVYTEDGGNRFLRNVSNYIPK
jgi:hypothetical protein